MSKITNANALAIAITNLTMETAEDAVIYDRDGVTPLSDEETAAVIERLTAMFDTAMKRAETAKNRERKPTAKELAAKEENAKLATATFEHMSERPAFLFECKTLAEDMGVSTPKMARILATLVEDGKVERIEGKKPNFKVKGE